MTISTTEKITNLELDNFQVILLLDTLQDLINNNGELDCDLKDYLELDNNPYERLYKELLEESIESNNSPTVLP